MRQRVDTPWRGGEGGALCFVGLAFAGSAVQSLEVCIIEGELRRLGQGNAPSKSLFASQPSTLNRVLASKCAYRADGKGGLDSVPALLPHTETGGMNHLCRCGTKNIYRESPCVCSVTAPYLTGSGSNRSNVPVWTLPVP